ncbi:hypothetical protein ACFW1A_33320 [Kitasatospora sp. NPDC058965]|uniref:hypothetical protein n=1 Tax=Kitasatospora sp. NPDC058965 TaxID=3346682 RepID=UPI0036805DCA
MSGSSRMTLRVYRLAPDGTRTELAHDEIAAYEPDGSRFLPDDPCRCRRCHPGSTEPTEPA